MTAGSIEEGSVWRWYHTLWYMHNADFRRRYIKDTRRSLRLKWKYERHIYFEKGGLAFALFGVFYLVASNRTLQSVVRWPTEDVNELLKQRSWRELRNEAEQRKERANQMLSDSNYMSEQNKRNV